MKENAQSLWRWKLLLLWNGIAVLLLLSFFNPWGRALWEKIDSFVFLHLNGALKGHRGWQHFWAMANHYLADWVEDIVIFVLYYVHVRSHAKELRRRKIAELSVATLFIIGAVYFINRVLFRYWIVIRRDSPTLVYEDSLRLSEEITWLHIKDDSAKCFPGDHATTALFFAASYCLFVAKRHAAIAVCCALFWCLPRMIAGAHWFSDVAVGSASICFVALSWFYCTPAFERIASFVCRMFPKRKIELKI